MKKFLATILALVITICICVPMTAFAAEEPSVAITPRATLDYNNHWHTKGQSLSGSFQVSGNGGQQVDMTVAVESFASNTIVEIVVHGGSSTSGPIIFSTSSWLGSGLSTGGTSEFQTPWNLVIQGYSTYTVEWCIINPLTDSSGRILCWVYN